MIKQTEKTTPAKGNIVSLQEPVFRSRRIGDPVSPLNEAVHDKIRMVQMAVEYLDRLDLAVLKIMVNNTIGNGHPSILIMPGNGCAQLEGKWVSKTPDCEKYLAHKFGCDITWFINRRTA